MGYTTDFSGCFTLNKQLEPKMKEFLTKFNETRRMKRNADDKFGIEGEFFVDGTGSFGQDHTSDVVDYNMPPKTQPGLWCQWTPTQDGCGIEWDGGEKFYNYDSWLIYIIEKILAPNGYVLNGTVEWQGEDVGDVGEIFVEDNKVFTQEWKGSKVEQKPTTQMQTGVVFLIEETKAETPKKQRPTEAEVIETIVKNASPKMAGLDLDYFRNAFGGKTYKELVKLFEGEN